MTTWFVSGAGRGLGAEIARRALSHGDRVIAAGRTVAEVRAAIPEDSPDLLVVPLEPTDEGQALVAVTQAVLRFGRLDVVVSATGGGAIGAVEEVLDEQARAVFDTTVFGLLNLARAVLPQLRAQRSGRIVAVSPAGGVLNRPGWGVSQAAARAVASITDTLTQELTPLGISVAHIDCHHLAAKASPLRIADYATTAARAAAPREDDIAAVADLLFPRDADVVPLRQATARGRATLRRPALQPSVA